MSIHIEPLVVPLNKRVRLTVHGLAPDSRHTVHLRARRQEGPGSEHTGLADGEGRLVLEHICRQQGEMWLDVPDAAPVVGGAHSRIFHSSWRGGSSPTPTPQRFMTAFVDDGTLYTTITPDRVVALSGGGGE